MSEQHKSRDNRADYRADTIMEHEYDGIQEFDNRLPNWWMWIMWGSMVFALFYWIVFHTLEIRNLSHANFEAEMARADEAMFERMKDNPVTNETLMALVDMPAKVQEGRETFVKFCVACHLDKGQGSVGPNLTDGVWIHGCEPMNLHETVTTGVAAKGMPAWGNQLGPAGVQTVVAYVMTLRNTNVAGKAPEGEPCTWE
ncbi:cytochrome oxidase subunit III [bacterium DOLJORAL78_65_58]|nr:MAG: cytochrome oxidase subunit III [bacterium DOLZORAL124_64_63]PIE75674.1 MAG: cytochrome oxidase subunit III [bacterium DOLJORAL78_65_58]